MKMKRIFLAADAGGSKTQWVLLSEEGKTVARCKTAGLGAVREGILPVRQTVAEAFERLLPFGRPSAVFLSLGGPNVAEVKDAIYNCIPDVPITVEREACGDAVLRAAKRLGCSSVVMCGTGSTAVGDTATGRRFAGGWGPIYGDGGSGGGLGSDALRVFLRALDGFEDAGCLNEVFAFLLDGEDVTTFAGRMAVKARAVELPRRELAATAPTIYEFAEKGDAVAMKLYDQAADEMVKLAVAVSDDDPAHTVLLCGGFLTDKPLLWETCRQKFAAVSRANLRYEPRFTPLSAAKVAVLEQNGIEMTEERFETIWRAEEEK